MSKNVAPIPQGFRSLTPHLVVSPAAKAMEFYARAFGAEELFRMPGPDGKDIMHASMRIGDSVFMLNDPMGPPNQTSAPSQAKTTTVVLHIYTPDVDALAKRATQAGAKVLMPVADMFWGDRYGQLADPFGHVWSIATKTEDPSPEEVARRMKEACA